MWSAFRALFTWSRRTTRAKDHRLFNLDYPQIMRSENPITWLFCWKRLFGNRCRQTNLSLCSWLKVQLSLQILVICMQKARTYYFVCLVIYIILSDQNCHTEPLIFWHAPRVEKPPSATEKGRERERKRKKETQREKWDRDRGTEGHWGTDR